MYNIIRSNLLDLNSFAILIATGICGFIIHPAIFIYLVYNVLIFINLINFIVTVLSSKIFWDFYYFLVDIDYYLYKYYLEWTKTEKEIIVYYDNNYDLENQIVRSKEYSELFMNNIESMNNSLLKLRLIQDMIGVDNLEKLSYKIEKKITKRIIDSSNTIYDIAKINMEHVFDLYLKVMICAINHLLIKTKYRLILNDNNRKINVCVLDKNDYNLNIYYEMFVLDDRLRKDILYYYLDYHECFINTFKLNPKYKDIIYEIVNTKIIDGTNKKMIKVDYLDYRLNKVNIDDLQLTYE